MNFDFTDDQKALKDEARRFLSSASPLAAADRRGKAGAARVSASNAYWLAARENIQTHGGIGFTWEADCQQFYRRARHLSLVLGSPRDWRRRLAGGVSDIPYTPVIPPRLKKGCVPTWPIAEFGDDEPVTRAA